MVLERQPHVLTGQRPGATGTVPIAVAQIAPRLGDVAANLERHLALIAEAAGAGAGLVVFPELSLTGYFLKDLVPEVALRLGSAEISRLREACRDIDAVVGCVLESDDVRFFNAVLYISGGEVVHVHRKVYLPTYGLFDEQRYLAPGDRFRTFTAGLGRRAAWQTGLLICEDMWHPTAPSLLARQGLEILLCPSASPGRGVSREVGLGTANSYDAMTRTYAQLFTSFLVYCNRVGYEDGVAFWGGSRVVGPDGDLLAPPAGSQETLLHFELERSALRRARIAVPLLRDERHDVNDAETDRIRRQRTGD